MSLTAAQLLATAEFTAHQDDDPPGYDVFIPELNASWGVAASSAEEARTKLLPLVDELVTGRSRLVAEIKSLLAQSDVWASRAVEEGIAMTPERVAYRRALRVALADATTIDDPSEVDLPTPPPIP